MDAPGLHGLLLAEVDPLRTTPYPPPVMISRLAFLLVLFTAATVSAAPRYLLLHNGNVIHGDVQLIDGQYLITREGAEIRLMAEAVRFVEPTLAGLVQRLRAETPRPRMEDRLRLAEWCARVELWDFAVQELLAAQQESPRDVRVMAAQRRLWHARQQAMQANMPAPRRVDPAVQQASYSEPVGEAPLREPLSKESSPKDSWHGPLPEGALQQFTRQVQPILVNNCTTSGCHHAGGPQEFELSRDLLHGLANRRSTEANLIACLRAIDLTNPQQSPLLAAMQPSHAGGRGPRLGVRGAKLQQTVTDWVMLVAGGKTASSKEKSSMKPADESSAANPPEGDVHAPGYFEALLEQDAAGPAPAPPEIQRGIDLKPASPRDEFDPAIFNQRHRRQPR